MPFSGVVVTGATIAEHVSTGKRAEELGYDDVWVTEFQGPDAVTVVASVACATEQIGLKTGIVSGYLRSPLLMAMTSNSLQDASNGRFALGLGTSTPAIVSNWHGLPWDRPLSRTREYVDLVRRFSAGERVKADGLYKTRGASLRPAVKPVPIYLGALNTRMLELAGEIADGVILNFPTPSYTKQAVESIERGIAASGRPREAVDIVAFLRTSVVGERARAVEAMRRELLTYFLAPVYQKVFGEDGYGAEVTAVRDSWAAGEREKALLSVSDRAVEDHSLLGTVEQVQQRVQTLLDCGVDRAILLPIVPDNLDRGPAVIQTVELLAPAAG